MHRGRFFIISFLSPDDKSLIGCKIHSVGFFYVKGLVPFGEVSWGHICAEDARTVNVY